MPTWQRSRSLVPYDVEDTGETVLLDPETDSVVALNPSLAAIWYLCDGSRDAAAITDQILQALPGSDRVAVLADVQSALAGLAQRGALVAVI